MVRVADGFRCRQCDGTIQEVDLAEDLMVDGETYEYVKSLKDRRTNEELKRMVGVEPITTFVRGGKQRWYGHVMRTG